MTCQAPLLFLKPAARAGSRGFSLVEVLCAILILGVGVVGLSQGVVLALSSSKESEVQTKAALLAAGRIEFLRADGFLTAGTTDGESGDALPGTRWTQAVQKADLDGLYEVTVTIEDSTSGTHLFELKTLLFEAPSLSVNEEPTDRKERQKPRRRAGGSR